MRRKASIITFFLTLVIGVSFGLGRSITDWVWPSFSKEAAAVMVGRRVRHRRSEKFVLMKSSDDGVCREVKDGELGTVIGIEQVPDGGYFLIVRWDEPADLYLSYFGRYTRRESLIEEARPE
ncbi:MAG TPA: hypothetical protein VGQ39_19670 [Pyrinomonadaceae bacterium]|nr:hypothetical protein [Pyrinomonadaceae bacterium]